MERNSITADNGRVRYVGRDFDLYFFEDENGTKLATRKELEAKAKATQKKLESYLGGWTGYKLVASTNCSFNSNATYETIVDKSTPKSGVKQLQSIEWSFQSDNNVTSLDDLRLLVNAHQKGEQLYVSMNTGDEGETADRDKSGSTDLSDDAFCVVRGWCVIQSITLNAQDGSLATFSMTLEGSGDYTV